MFEMNITPDELTLFCCMLGTDYNRHIKNIKGVGPVNALKLIKEYHSLDLIEKENKLPRKDKENSDNGLIYNKCKELFSLTYPDIKDILYWDLRIDIEAIVSFLKTLGITTDTDRIKRLWVAPKIKFTE